MWIVKIPKRYDFCGMPPCGLCFDWVEGESAPVDGIVKMARDVLGKESITEEEERQLIAAAEHVHVIKKAEAEKRLPPIADLAAAYDDRQAVVAMGIQLAAAVKARKAAPTPPKRAVLLDQIDMPNPVPAAPPPAPVLEYPGRIGDTVRIRGRNVTIMQDTGQRQMQYNLNRDRNIVVRQVVMSDGSMQWIPER